MTADETQAAAAVRTAGQAARAAAPSLAGAPGDAVDAALGAMAEALRDAAPAVLAANAADMQAAQENGLPAGVRDRLRLDDGRLKAMAEQLDILAGVAPEPAAREIRELPGGLVLSEYRRPVGVIGANFEARPNVVVDIASQLVKSRNAGVLRTGSAALRSAIALADEVIAPALRPAGLDPAAVQLVRVPGQAAAYALVSEPKLIPLVILRGSGDSTRSLAAAGAAHGVRTLAHADGGGVLYLHSSAERALASTLIASSLDRLGVCNRLNLLLVDRAAVGRLAPGHRRAAGRARPAGLAPAARPPARLRVGARPRARGHGHHRPGRRPGRGRRDRQRPDLGPGRGHRRGRRGGGGRVPRRVHGHRRLLERDDQAARRVQAVRGAGDRDQPGRGARPARPGDLPRPVPAPARGHAQKLTL